MKPKYICSFRTLFDKCLYFLSSVKNLEDILLSPNPRLTGPSQPIKLAIILEPSHYTKRDRHLRGSDVMAQGKRLHGCMFGPLYSTA